MFSPFDLVPSSKCPTVRAGLALNCKHLPSIMSSTAIGRLTSRSGAGEKQRKVVNLERVNPRESGDSLPERMERASSSRVECSDTGIDQGVA